MRSIGLVIVRFVLFEPANSRCPPSISGVVSSVSLCFLLLSWCYKVYRRESVRKFRLRIKGMRSFGLVILRFVQFESANSHCPPSISGIVSSVSLRLSWCDEFPIVMCSVGFSVCFLRCWLLCLVWDREYGVTVLYMWSLKDVNSRACLDRVVDDLPMKIFLMELLILDSSCGCRHCVWYRDGWDYRSQDAWRWWRYCKSCSNCVEVLQLWKMLKLL
jgi:hypothetical protein